MKIYYWNNETDDIISEDVFRSDYYDKFNDDELSYDEYLARSMTYNNGVLMDVSDRRAEVKKELDRKLMLARKYGYDEYADELYNLLAELDRLGKYTGRA